MRALAFGRRILRFCRSEDAKADRVTRVMIILSRSREIWRHVGEFLEPLSTRGGACYGHWTLSSWVLVGYAVEHVYFVGFIR